jgi:inosine-uridine nucleoside N-ribohydrolase/formylmethanofuran dehydrogenase subunit E
MNQIKGIFLAVCLILCILVSLSSFGQFHKKQVIIDTDCAADDFRAISTILELNQIEILAITTCDGVLSPETGEQKVKELLSQTHHEGIPTATGRIHIADYCKCREINSTLHWGDNYQQASKNQININELLLRICKNNHQPISFIALGPLTNLSDLLTEHPELIQKIDTVFWYNSGIQSKQGFNYESDSNAAEKIIKSSVNLIAISNCENNPLRFDSIALNGYKNYSNPSATNVFNMLHKAPLLNIMELGHLSFWDDLIPIYISFPSLFQKTKISENHFENQLKSSVVLANVDSCLKILYSEKEPENIIFRTFPFTPENYAYDFSDVCDTIIKKYGKEEFRAGVLTNEFHGHLGIYSIIGVKMGIRALDYFHCSIDELEVTSLAGSAPPISCLNDGIQVSTGATIGHGLIIIHPTEKDLAPAAIFTHKNMSVKITLKNEIAQMISEDINSILKLSGDFNDQYWESVRKLAVKYWLELDRNSIFEINPINYE